MSDNSPIAYFSAEFGLSDEMPIFAGGLGILAGDILKEAADSQIPIIGVGLFYHHGFFRQVITEGGKQEDEFFTVHPKEVDLEEVLDPETGEPLIVKLNFPAEPVEIWVWKKRIQKTESRKQILEDGGQRGDEDETAIDLYLLDAALPQNKPFEVEYTGNLYQEGWAPRLSSEIVLGVGGVRLLNRLGISPRRWHLNDDHSALSILERLSEDKEKETVFTTHTPVPGAVSVFEVAKIRPYLEALFSSVGATRKLSVDEMIKLGLDEDGNFNLTVLALRMADKINGVSQRHGKVANDIWQKYLGESKITAITNGVHPPTWISEPMDHLYRKWLGTDYLEKVDQPKTWAQLLRSDSSSPSSPSDFYRDLWNARLQCKQNLIDQLPNLLPKPLITSYQLPVTTNALFLGFARRFAPYKQADSLIYNLDRLATILTNPERPIYLFISGKAHYNDPVGQGILRGIIAAARDLRIDGHVFFLEDYDMEAAKALIPGVDLWLNTPRVPMEASGTSGMKALYNGVLNCSVSDGWWWEVVNSSQSTGHNAQLGFTIGPSDPSLSSSPSKEQTAEELYALLENEVVPLYYQREEGIPMKWLTMVKDALVTLGPRFNTRRMLREYQEELYK